MPRKQSSLSFAVRDEQLLISRRGSVSHRIRIWPRPNAEKRDRTGRWERFYPEFRIISYPLPKPKKKPPTLQLDLGLEIERNSVNTEPTKKEAYDQLRQTMPRSYAMALAPFKSHQWNMILFLSFKRRFYDLIRRINSDSFSTEIQQEECDFFFKYQLEEVHHVRKSKVEAKRIIDLIKKAALKGYDMSMIIEDHGEFLKKYGFDDQDDYQANCDLIVEYQRIIAREPGNADAHCNLGILYERQGMIQLAVSQYRKALAIDYNNARSKRALERLKVDLF